MASRFHQQRDSARSSLFSGYDQQSRSRPTSASPAPGSRAASGAAVGGGGYGYSSYNPAAAAAADGSSSNAFSAYPGSSGGGLNADRGSPAGSFRTATPNTRGQYSDAVLSELESQNDEQVSEMSRKVAMLKDITVRIGDEIRDSTALAEKMNDQFGNTSAKLQGTMNRMLRMAQKTGVGWKVWLGFFAFVVVLFWYVWL